MTTYDAVSPTSHDDSVNEIRTADIPASVIEVLLHALAPAQSNSALRVTLNGLAAWHAYRMMEDPAQRARVVAAAEWLLDPTQQATSDQVPSALLLGLQISLLCHAQQIADGERFRAGAVHAAYTLAQDIFEGGASSPLGTDGIFFQTVAAYPASHDLVGMLIALLALQTLHQQSGNLHIARVYAQGLATLDQVFDEFDAGFWSYANLLRRRLTTTRLHALQAALLAALANSTGEARWQRRATRWATFSRQSRNGIRARLAGKRDDLTLVLSHCPPSSPVLPEPICVPITAFPVMGGIRAVLTNVAQFMADDWRMEFVTRHVGPDRGSWAITRFGNALTSPQHFPFVWLYAMAGERKLAQILRRDHRYRTVLAQDGAFTGAFAALASRRTGHLVVCMEHGTVTLPFNATHQRERLAAIAAQPLPQRILARLLLPAYWPTVTFFARQAARHAHRYLVAGDETEEALRDHAGVRASQIIRWRFAVDAARFAPLALEPRRAIRMQHGCTDEMFLIALVCRLSPEKGLDIALAGIHAALDRVPPDLQGRVRVVIAGAGPLHDHLEAQIQRLQLQDVCQLVGELAPDEVIALLQACDCFLYTSVRGTNISMAVLEAMSTGCTIIATTEPISNLHLLADGRGLAIPAHSIAAISDALVTVLHNIPAGRAMGQAARVYILQEHSPAVLKRALLRATHWVSAASPVVTTR